MKEKRNAKKALDNFFDMLGDYEAPVERIFIKNKNGIEDVFIYGLPGPLGVIQFETNEKGDYIKIGVRQNG